MVLRVEQQHGKVLLLLIAEVRHGKVRRILGAMDNVDLLSRLLRETPAELDSSQDARGL